MDLVDMQKLSQWNKGYIGTAPQQVTEQTVPEVWDKLYGQRLDQKTPPLKCQVGDRVRLNKKHRPFKKGYLARWTEQVFVVMHVRCHLVVTYRLSKWDGRPIKRTFYEPDVQKVQVLDNSLFHVEKVLKRKGQNVLVWWKGWPSKYDSWIPAQRHGPTKTKRPAQKIVVVGKISQSHQGTMGVRQCLSPGRRKSLAKKTMPMHKSLTAAAKEKTQKTKNLLDPEGTGTGLSRHSSTSVFSSQTIDLQVVGESLPCQQTQSGPVTIKGP